MTVRVRSQPAHAFLQGPFASWETTWWTIITRYGAKAEEASFAAILARDLDALIDSGMVRRESEAGQPRQDRFVVPGPVRRFAAEQTSQTEIEKIHTERRVAFFRTVARQGFDSLWAFSSTPRNDLDADSKDLLAAFDFTCAHDSTAHALTRLRLTWSRSGSPWVGNSAPARFRKFLAVLRPQDGGVLPGTDMGLVAQALTTLVVLRLWSRHPILGDPASDLINQAIDLTRAAGRPDMALRAVEALVHLVIAQGRHGEHASARRRRGELGSRGRRRVRGDALRALARRGGEQFQVTRSPLSTTLSSLAIWLPQPTTSTTFS